LVAVVTGGSRGIGKGVARALLPGTIQEAVEEVNSLGGRGIAVAYDLSIDQEIRSLFEPVGRDDCISDRVIFPNIHASALDSFYGRKSLLQAKDRCKRALQRLMR
jgi:NAD(P)-dependent dehydrogenase (short-subunit alcohol dehydrogenase family)